MTIDVTIPRETNSLIQLSQTTFFPTKIPKQHHQLKNFISTSAPDVICYASDDQVYALHVSSRKRELIASLPWKPQCLDSGHGWICIGGSEGGRCAFIFVGEEDLNESRNRAVHNPAEVDALLPLDLDPESRLLARNFLQQSQSFETTTRRRKPEVQIHEVGESIVNSVTIHRLHSELKGFEDEVVVVLTNNDKTVRIFSLTQSRILDTLCFPTQMNHALISPDGKLLVAVGDKPQAFFYRRLRLPGFPNVGEVTFARYAWQKIAEPKLSLAPSSDACFSTAYSPSGHICAVASQAGTITIFSTSMIRDDMDPDEAVLDVLKSSRPCLGLDYSGAVRSMSFAPAPWDLFAWAEDQGRACVVDLRNAFRSRQTIELEIESPSLNRINMSDLEESQSTSEQRQLEIEARFVERHREALDAQDHLAAVSHATAYIEIAAERRRIEREAREGGSMALREEFNALTENERQLLDTIRLNRNQESERARPESAQQNPFSLNYLQPSVITSDRQVDAQNATGASSSLPAAVAHNAAQANRVTNSIHDYMRQRNLDRNRAGDRSYQPRRRSSVVISNGNPTNASNSSHPSSLAPIGTATPTLSASPSRLASNAEDTTTTSTSGDPWPTTVELAATGNTNGDTAARSRRERETALARTADRRVQQQQQVARLERVRNASANMQRLRLLHGMTIDRPRTVESMYDDHEQDMMRRIADTPGRREEGVGTMGVGWSVDGRSLYVATEEGIFEYAVNIDERKTFPEMRLQ